ncbi:MAG: hypothetical protein ABIR57_07570 [Aeromicrobium sp.]
MTITESINAQVKSIVEDVKGLPTSFKKVDVSDLKKQATTFAQTTLGQATSAYADLTKKGEELVAKAKGLKVDDVKADAQKAAADLKVKAEVLADDVKVKGEELVADVKAKGEEFVAEAKATVNKVAKKAPAAKPAAKKPAAKKAPAKKAPAKKA